MSHDLHNPYWDAVKQHAKPAQTFFSGEAKGLEIGGLSDRSDPAAVEEWASGAAFALREMAVRCWSWSIPDPDSLDFVVRYARGRIIDPMAGTGYWSYLLTQLGVDCVSYDLEPPQGADAKNNFYHGAGEQFVTVLPGDAADVVTVAGEDRTLFLSWPPYDSPVGYHTLKAYPGDRVIFIGEGEGGCTADDGFFHLLEKEWAPVDWHRPVQYYGLHDLIMVFDRIESGTGIIGE